MMAKKSKKQRTLVLQIVLSLVFGVLFGVMAEPVRVYAADEIYEITVDFTKMIPNSAFFPEAGKALPDLSAGIRGGGIVIKGENNHVFSSAYAYSDWYIGSSKIAQNTIANYDTEYTYCIFLDDTYELKSGVDPFTPSRDLVRIDNSLPSSSSITIGIQNNNNPIYILINFPKTSSAPQSQPAVDSGGCANGHASYTWQTVAMPDVHNDGEEICVCEGCGQVLYRVPISAYGYFQKDAAQRILHAAQGATVEITTSRWISFHRSVMEALAARPDVTLTVSFLDGEYRGNRYSVTIPAGYDTLSLLNGTDYCGFLYLGSKFGLKPE